MGLNIAGKEASSFQTIIDITGACCIIVFDALCVHGFTYNNKAVPLPCILIIVIVSKIQ